MKGILGTRFSVATFGLCKAAGVACLIHSDMNRSTNFAINGVGRLADLPEQDRGIYNNYFCKKDNLNQNKRPKRKK